MKLIKENIPFTMVANEVLKDKNLSFKAKGMYAYLFSKPDEWDFSSNRMILESRDGREAIMGMLRELEENGYLNRQRLPNGKMEYTLKHTTKSLSRETPLGLEKPKSGFTTVGKSLGGVSRLVSNIEGENKEGGENNTESVHTPSEICSLFFQGKDVYQEMLDQFSEGNNQNIIKKEFDKFILYWTEPNKSGTKVRWQQQDTFEIKRRLLTWMNRVNSFTGRKETKIL